MYLISTCIEHETCSNCPDIATCSFKESFSSIETFDNAFAKLQEELIKIAKREGFSLKQLHLELDNFYRHLNAKRKEQL